MTFNSNAQENNVKYFSNDEGVLSIMYHRFNEFKYPSTNISMDIFKEHVDLILDANLTFYHPKDFVNEFDIPKKKKRFFLLLMMHFSPFTIMHGLT